MIWSCRHYWAEHNTSKTGISSRNCWYWIWFLVNFSTAAAVSSTTTFNILLLFTHLKLSATENAGYLRLIKKHDWVSTSVVTSNRRRLNEYLKELYFVCEYLWVIPAEWVVKYEEQGAFPNTLKSSRNLFEIWRNSRISENFLIWTSFAAILYGKCYVTNSRWKTVLAHASS